MEIKSVRIKNYKSFYDSREFELEDGISVLLGRNNSGKSALLEALSLSFEDNPHRSLHTQRVRNAQLDPHSTIEVTFRLVHEDLVHALNYGETVLKFVSSRASGHDFASIITLLFDEGADFRLYYAPGTQIRGTFIQLPYVAPLQNFILKYDPTNRRFVEEDNIRSVEAANLFVNFLRNAIYRFQAERLHIGSHPIGSDNKLLPDARNLPQVLHTLQSSNVARFYRYNELVKAIFPEILQITTPPRGTNSEIMLWGVDPSLEREDLAISLKQSGTGVGQVLAMLYVIVVSDAPQILLIDEPNSFLHPEAVRRLIGIFKTFPQHQYIITTHSPTVLSAVGPRQIALVSKHDSASEVEILDSRTMASLRISLATIGATFGDLLGAEQIIWVEGATEELCVPMILDKLVQKATTGAAILPVSHTSDFDRRQKELVLQLYSRISSLSTVLPRTVTFVFDREDRTAEEIEEFKRLPGPRVLFTNRRMYENYLLVPEAIAAVLTDVDVNREKTITPHEISDWLNRYAIDHKYYSTRSYRGKPNTGEWRSHVHGARLLSDLFLEVTDHRVEYRKTTHSVLLTEWLLEHDTSTLKELASILEGLF